MKVLFIVLIAVAVAAVLGASAYVLAAVVFKPEINFTINGYDSQLLATQHNFTSGKPLTLKARTRRVAKVDWSYSVDDGVTFVDIVKGVDPTTGTTWVPPGSVYSNTVTVKCEDGGSDNGTLSVTSGHLALAPSFELLTGGHSGVTMTIPSTIVLAYTTTTTLIDTVNLVLSTSTDGTTFTTQTDFTVSPTEKKVRWGVSTNALAGKSVYVRIRTNNLVAAGHPDELQATSSFPIALQSGATSSTTAVSGVFSRLGIFTNVEQTTQGAVFSGQTVYLQLTVVGVTLTLADLGFAYSTDGGSTFVVTSTVTVQNLATNTYAWKIPAGLAGKSVLLRVTQTSATASPQPSILSNTISVISHIKVLKYQLSRQPKTDLSTLTIVAANWGLSLDQIKSLDPTTKEPKNPPNWSVDLVTLGGIHTLSAVQAATGAETPELTLKFNAGSEIDACPPFTLKFDDGTVKHTSILKRFNCQSA